MAKILCVDDDPAIRLYMQEALSRNGYECLCVSTKKEALESLHPFAPDLVLLDFLLQDTNGLDVLEQIKIENDNIPVIMVSGRGEAIDRVIGIEAGADDYLAKPIMQRELMARINAVLKRTQKISSHQQAPASNAKGQKNPDLIHFGHWILDKKRFDVLDGNGNSAGLTTNEFKVLEKLASSPFRTFEREQIFQILQNRSMDVADRAVDIQITRIRKKLGDQKSPAKYIKTIRGVGYMFCCETQ